MFQYKCFVSFVISLTFILAETHYNVLWSNPYKSLFLEPELLLDQKLFMPSEEQEKVDIKVYYECMCPLSRKFYVNLLVSTIQRLGKYLNIGLYPYGNAITVTYPGRTEILCQSGPAECYGNRLHACAINYFKNNIEAAYFNACMMDFSQGRKGSDDAAASKCGTLLNVYTVPIKICAKSQKGFQLLKYYGDITKKAHIKGVPYILINGEVINGDYFLQDVCRAFINPPPECMEHL